MSENNPRCASCGMAQTEHHLNGAAYGVCAKFVAHRPDGDGLRTCPCCAGVSSFAEEWPGHLVACENARCGVRSGIFPTKPMARRAWNTRPQPTRDGAKPAPDAPVPPADGAQVPLADHDDIGRKVLTQPWDIQSVIVTIAAHCVALKDEYAGGLASDIAGCISQDCMKLANALTSGAGAAEPVARSVLLDTHEGLENLLAWTGATRSGISDAEERAAFEDDLNIAQKAFASVKQALSLPVQSTARPDREAVYTILKKYYAQDATLDAACQELKEVVQPGAGEREAPVLVKRPVAFRVKRADESNDWRIFNDEQKAREEAEQTDADMQGLYVRDGTVITQDRAIVAAEVMEQCARAADSMADAQEATNKKYPDHAKAYDTWVRAVDNYRDVAKTIRVLSQAPPSSSEGGR